MTYTCDTFHADLDDRLDDLLEPAVAAAFDAHLAGCGACQATHTEGVALRGALYRPYAVDPLPADLRARIDAAAQARRPSRTALVLRYAASFAAGVPVTLVLTTGEAPGAAPRTASMPDANPRTAPADPAPAAEAPASSAPLRRIR